MQDLAGKTSVGGDLRWRRRHARHACSGTCRAVIGKAEEARAEREELYENR